MEFQDEIRRQQELRKANISNSFESVRGTDIEKGKWKLGDIDPKYPNYFVAELKPNGSPVWKSKNKHSSHPALAGKKADKPSVDPNTQKYDDKDYASQQEGKEKEEEKVDMKAEVVSRLGGNFKERNYKSPSGGVMAFSRNTKGLEEQVEFTKQPDGQIYVYLFRKKEVSSRSLADPKANYQTTSARVVKHETKKVRKYVDSQEKALKELDKFLKVN